MINLILNNEKIKKIISTILILIAVILLMIFLMRYSYKKGYADGTLYTSVTGKIPYVAFDKNSNTTISGEVTLEDYWKKQCSDFITYFNMTT